MEALLLAIRLIFTAALAGVGLATCSRDPERPSGPPEPPDAAGSPVLSTVPITPYGYKDETSIAIDPTHPDHVIASWQIPASVAASSDGGVTWRTAALPAVEAFELAGDPAVSFDADGHAYALYIAFDRPQDYDTLGAKAHRNGIFLNRSDDGGVTWRGQPAPVIYQPEQPGIPFEDKPMLGIDRSSQPGRRGNVYVAWTEFRRHESVILFARSTDGGLSFSAPLEISDRPGSPKDSVGADEGTDIAVGPDGTVYVVWSDSTGIRLDRSTDAGASFGGDVLVASTPDIVFGVPGISRSNGYPSLEIDPATGRLFVEWIDGRLGPTAVFLAASDDGGATWSAPGAVDGDRSDDHFFAWMGLDPTTGLLAVGYYRSTPDMTMTYRLSWSTDGGRTFQHTEWSANAFHGGGEFIGDYTGVDAYGGRAFAAWTEIEPARSGGGRGTRVVVGKAVFQGLPVR